LLELLTLSPSEAMRGLRCFADADYELYLSLLNAACTQHHISCLGYVLTPNHVHLIFVPKKADGLSKAMSALHRAYAGVLNARRKKTGHFWQGRFGCVALDAKHSVAALRKTRTVALVFN
jgi:putative transposase